MERATQRVKAAWNSSWWIERSKPFWSMDASSVLSVRIRASPAYASSARRTPSAPVSAARRAVSSAMLTKRADSRRRLAIVRVSARARESRARTRSASRVASIARPACGGRRRPAARDG